MFDIILILISPPKFVGEMYVTWSASYRLTNPYLPRSDMLPSPSQFPIFLSSRLTIIFRGMLVVTTCAFDCFNYGKGEGLKVRVGCQKFKYWLPCFIVSCWFFINAYFPMENKSSSSPYALLLLCSI